MRWSTDGRRRRPALRRRRHRAVRDALLAAGAVASARTPPSACASNAGARATASTSTTPSIPQEAGLNERAVSFTKGCYVGQETVARLHYRGKPNRHLRGLRLCASRSPPAAELRLGERAVGRVGSVAVSPRSGPIALALVRREAEPGATVERRRRRDADGRRAAVLGSTRRAGTQSSIGCPRDPRCRSAGRPRGARPSARATPRSSGARPAARGPPVGDREPGCALREARNGSCDADVRCCAPQADHAPPLWRRRPAWAPRPGRAPRRRSAARRPRRRAGRRPARGRVR